MLLVLAAIVAWLLPVATAWIAWRMARRSYGLMKKGIRTSGQVMTAAARSSTIQYAVGRADLQIKTEWYMPSAVGAAAMVVYAPDSPECACVHHWQDLWMPAILWMCAAIFFAVLDISY